MILLDAHCHLHEYSDRAIESEIEPLSIYIIAVSDDYASSIRTIELSKRFKFVIPAIGIHPWTVDGNSINDVDGIAKLVDEYGVRMLGEIGLDKKFRYETLDKQITIYRKFLEIARDRDLAVNVHAAGAWREVLDLLYRHDVSLAIIHWYTGPIELLKEIHDRGYKITVNPAIAIQEKHRDVVRSSPLEIVLLESDAPYRYRGLEMHPKLVFESIKHIASLKGIDVEVAMEIISRNSEEVLYRLK